MVPTDLVSITYNEEYYQSTMKEYGYDPFAFGRFTFNLGKLTREELQCRWLCHDGGNLFAENLQAGRKGIIATGFGLSGIPHVGTLSQILRSFSLQRAGIPISVVLGDLDAYNNKNTPLSKTQELADHFQEFIFNLGFVNQPPSVLRRQITDHDTLLRAYLIGRYMDDEILKKAEEDLYVGYNRDVRDPDSTMIFRRKLSLTLMTADFLNLYYREGHHNVMIMLGVDEHRFVRLARTVAERIAQDRVEPEHQRFSLELSGIYTRIIKGLNNYPKMSKSYGGSGITVDMSPDQILDLVINGEGRYNYPEDNVVYQMMSGASTMSLDEIARAYSACKRGGLDWAREKKRYADTLIALCSVWGK